MLTSFLFLLFDNLTVAVEFVRKVDLLIQEFGTTYSLLDMKNDFLEKRRSEI